MAIAQGGAFHKQSRLTSKQLSPAVVLVEAAINSIFPTGERLLQQQNAQNAIPRLGRRSPAPSAVDLPSFTSGFLPSLPAYLSQRNPKRAAPYDLVAYLQRQPAPMR
jgi:hypothetical protein